MATTEQDIRNGLYTKKRNWPKLTIIPLERWHLDFIQQKPGDLSFGSNSNFEYLMGSQKAYAAFFNSYLMFCGGLVHEHGKVGTLWCVSSKYTTMEPYARFLIARNVLRYIKYFEDELGYERLQTIVWDEFVDSVRWLSRMGFVFEGYHEKAGPGGENLITLARVKR